LRLLHMLAGALLLLHQPIAASAQTVWDMTTEYPQSAMSGLGLTTFAQHVGALTAEKLVIRPSFDAAKGIRSADMLTAIAQGRIQAGDAFAGSLEAEDAIFALPSLPFLVTSMADAGRLADLARPYLAAALQGRGEHLLYLTPWPPSGIWSKTPLKTPSDLSGLSIRTYDRISSEIFARAGAKATSIGFAETLPRLVDGSINAVLSSGDGDSGRRLWAFLPRGAASLVRESRAHLPKNPRRLHGRKTIDGRRPRSRRSRVSKPRLRTQSIWFTRFRGCCRVPPRP
jgi:TRAP-type C4-dicarboxylate transport system substrate-binding protein